MRAAAVAFFFFSVCSCDAAPGASLPAPQAGAADITVASQPPGAGIVVDGIAVGAAPITVKLNPGPHRLRASMSGYYPAPETKIVVERGVAATHTLPLVASH